jgi:DNA-binding IclR family transcriptional regulator
VLGSIYIENNDIYKSASPVVKKINELTGEVVTVNILDGRGNVRVLIREERKIGFRWSTHSSYPAYASAGGKLLMSNLSDGELDAIYPEEKLKKVAAKTISTKTQLKQQLREIQKTGVAFTREEYLDGIESVASLIRNSKNEVVATLGIAMPIFGVSKIKKLNLDKLVRLGASLISYRLGYTGGDSVVKDINEMIDLWKHPKQTLKFGHQRRNK